MNQEWRIEIWPILHVNPRVRTLNRRDAFLNLDRLSESVLSRGMVCLEVWWRYSS